MGGEGGCVGPCRRFLVFVQGRSSLMRRGVVTPPYGCNAGGARQRADVGIGPYAPRGDERAARRGRRALRVVAESRRDCPGQRRTAERLRQRVRGRGGNRRKDHPKRGTAAATAQAALSEAESAERAAGQIRSLPDTLRVQHGAESPEV